MEGYYQRIILNERVETYGIQDDIVHLIIESADILDNGTELGYFKFCETNLTPDEVAALEGIEEITDEDYKDYADNANDWVQFIPGSRPPKIPRP